MSEYLRTLGFSARYLTEVLSEGAIRRRLKRHGFNLNRPITRHDARMCNKVIFTQEIREDLDPNYSETD